MFMKDVSQRSLRSTGVLFACAWVMVLCGGGGMPSAASQTPAPAPTLAPPSPLVASREVTFPLHVEAGKRFLVDAAATPFLLHGDAAWSLIVQLTREDVDVYLDDRRARGFNTLLVNLLEHKFANNAPQNVYGQAPFLVPGDFSTPNGAYFAHADWVLRRAAEKGFLVLLVPAYLGYRGGDEGWYQEMVVNGATKLRNYGRFLGQRYQDFTNVLWVHGGDYNPPEKGVVRAIVDGIREYDTRALHSAHGAPETAAVDYWGSESWLQVNNIYTYHTVYSTALQQYERPEKLPFFLIESTYENEHGISQQGLRTQAYHAWLSGAMGQVFGNNPIWHFNASGAFPSISMKWQQVLNGHGSQSMTHLHNLFAQRRWWTLEPDSNRTMLTGGLRSGEDRAVAVRDRDRAFAIVYLPSIRTVTVNLGQLTGPKVNARWYDPTNGIYSRVAGSPFVASGSQFFRPIGHNAHGFGDWVLVLESLP
jgi:Protein of unknown function (DUF4038)/Putative collagen-binding domain of a collagenase